MGKELSTQGTLNSYELSNNKSNVYLWLHQIIDGVKTTKFTTFENLVNAVYSLLSDAFTPETALIGEGKIWFGLTAPEKWLLTNGDTIGNAVSGADHAQVGYLALFEFLWNNHTDVSCPVSGGRGATAAADFTAGKTLTLPNACGRTLIGSGQGSGLTTRVLGDILGEEAHANTLQENGPHTHTGPSHTHTGPSHTHTIAHTHPIKSRAGGGGDGSVSIGGIGETYDHTQSTLGSSAANSGSGGTGNTGSGGTGATGSSGSGAAHNTMQPSIVVNFIIYSGVTS